MYSYHESYKVVDYISSEGSQIINLPCYSKSSIITQIKFRYTKNSGNCFFGYSAPAGDESGIQYRFFGYTNDWYWDLNKVSSYRLNTNNKPISSTTDYEFELGNRYVKDLQTGAYVLGSASTSQVTAFSSTAKFTVFGTGETGRIYYIKCYDGSYSKLVCDLIPVKRVGDGSCGLWDKVSKQFFMASGIGCGSETGEIITEEDIYG